MTDPIDRREDPDPGEPIAEIAGLEEEPDEGFLDRVRRSIDRRVGGGDLLEFAVPTVLAFLRELGAMLFGAFDRPRKPGGNREDDR